MCVCVCVCVNQTLCVCCVYGCFCVCTVCTCHKWSLSNITLTIPTPICEILCNILNIIWQELTGVHETRLQGKLTASYAAMCSLTIIWSSWSVINLFEITELIKYFELTYYSISNLLIFSLTAVIFRYEAHHCDLGSIQVTVNASSAFHSQLWWGCWTKFAISYLSFISHVVNPHSAYCICVTQSTIFCDNNLSSHHFPFVDLLFDCRNHSWLT